jgi:hypothetical protein
VYTLVRHLRSPVATLREVLTLAVSIIIAELFYKFHSFSLECLAFLATWTALGGLNELGGRLLLKEDERNENS